MNHPKADSDSDYPKDCFLAVSELLDLLAKKAHIKFTSDMTLRNGEFIVDIGFSGKISEEQAIQKLSEALRKSNALSYVMTSSARTQNGKPAFCLAIPEDKVERIKATLRDQPKHPRVKASHIHAALKGHETSR